MKICWKDEDMIHYDFQQNGILELTNLLILMIQKICSKDDFFYERMQSDSIWHVIDVLRYGDLVVTCCS